jgi:hypothetical protein
VQSTVGALYFCKFGVLVLTFIQFIILCNTVTVVLLGPHLETLLYLISLNSGMQLPNSNVVKRETQSKTKNSSNSFPIRGWPNILVAFMKKC